MKKTTIIGLTRIRNEEAIIKDTLDHMATFCSKVYVYDDASTDNTMNICLEHPIVAKVKLNPLWSIDREWAETVSRRELLEMAQELTDQAEDAWFVYMDADERIEYEWSKLSKLPRQINGVKMRLFDFYITPSDYKKPYTEREYIGPEYREILMAFRNTPGLKYNKPDQRSPIVPGPKVTDGWVKHYGKAVSVEQWEETCDYYANHFPKYADKWRARKGRAIHTFSDFGRPLCRWENREKFMVKLY